MNKPSGYRGYCSPNSFGGYQIPVPMQNTLYREYVQKNGLIFMLSMNELYFKDCYIQLHELIDTSQNLSGILMCSIYMLPKQGSYRTRLLEKCLNYGTEVHFILDNFILKNRNDMENINYIYKLGNITNLAPKSIEIKKNLKQ